MMTTSTFLRHAATVLIVGTLAACSSGPRPIATSDQPVVSTRPDAASASATVLPSAGDAAPLPAMLVQPRSRWVPARWADLPGFADDNLFDAWNAWIKSCQRPGPVFAPLCAEVRQLSIGSAAEQRAWMTSRLQPYRVESLDGVADGLLTSYYEPLVPATRLPVRGSSVPLYRAPADLGSRKPWFSRQQIESQPDVQAALRGREIAYIADPVEAMVLHIQGSGRLRITEPDGSQRLVRLAYAGTNDQPYKSIGKWLLDQGLVKDATWPGIRGWIAQNPQRVNELLWSNPRFVFFREEPLSEADAAYGPRGAQGVELTPGRSIAVDRQSIPYGTPVWLASSGSGAAGGAAALAAGTSIGANMAPLQRLVLAQDTGSAIVGAVRADFFAGWGPDAGEVAGRLKHGLRMWVLWPKSQ